MAFTLDDLVAGVRGAAGDDLVCVVLYGSAAGRDYHGAKSDQNVMVLLREAGAGALDALGPVVRRWVGVGNPPPLLLTLDEWRARSDVFAIEYADLLERHRVVAGVLPLDGIVVRRQHLRLQLESEAMGKLLRIRRGIMSAGGDTERLRSLVEDALPGMLALLRATVHLHGEAAAESSDALCDRAAALAAFDAAPFHVVLAARRAARPIGDDAVVAAAHGYLEALTRLVAHADALRVEDHA